MLQEEFNEAADAWFLLEAGSFPAVPRPVTGGDIAVRSLLPLPVRESAGYSAHEEDINAAILILSQSPAARQLAVAALNAGYAIFVDPPVMGGAGAAHEAEAMGAADHVNKRIHLRSGAAPQSLALVLAHELAHISQIVNGGLDLDIRHSHPAHSIKQLLAMEADARAREMQVAIELSYAAKDDPAERLLFPDMVAIATRDIGTAMIGGLMERAAPRLPHDIGVDKIMAGVFKSFYGSPSMRAHYEATILEALNRTEDADLKNPALFTGSMTTAALVSRLDGHLTPAYIAPQAPHYIDLDSSIFNSVSPETRDKIAALGAARGENHDWHLPVYGVIPAASKPLTNPSAAPRRAP